VAAAGVVTVGVTGACASGVTVMFVVCVLPATSDAVSVLVPEKLAAVLVQP
jgi:hypothetical protein